MVVCKCPKSRVNPRHLRTTDSGNIQVVSPPPPVECPKPGEYLKNGKRYLRVVTRDCVRDLVVPDPEGNVNSVLLDPRELNQLLCTGEAHIKDKEKDKKAMIETTKMEEAARSDLRKRELRKYITYRELGPKLNKLEFVAKEKANFLLQKAKEVSQEDEDDIKLCNNLLLGTKCQAIRDAQIVEKKQIERELREEEERLEMMMEQGRKKMLAREKEEELMKKRQREEYVKALNYQLERNLLEREMEQEKNIEESMILREQAMKTQIDELRAGEDKRKQQQKIRDEMNKINEEIQSALEQEKRNSKLEDLKIQELMRQKAEDEKMQEERHLGEKQAREKELAKMRASQKKATDKQAKMDAERAAKIKAKYEYEWRLKEKQAAEDKKREIERLKEERRLQIQERQRAQAREIEKDLEEACRLEMMETQMRERERKEKERKQREKDEYKAGLLKQMNEKEKEKIRQRKGIFEDGILTVMELKENQESLQANMKRKVNSIRSHNIPDKYISDVERKLKYKTNAGYD